MVKIKNFQSFQESSLTESEVAGMVIKTADEASSLPPEKIHAAAEDAEKMAKNYGYELKDLADPKVAAEVLLRTYSSEAPLTEDIDEGFLDWFNRVKSAARKIFIKIGMYGGLSSTILSLIGVGTTLGMEERTTPSWFWELCQKIFPQPENWSFLGWKIAMAAIFVAAIAVSSIVAVYSSMVNSKNDQEQEYKNF